MLFRSATRALRDLIRSLRAGGHCVLFSSHVMQEVAALCDRIVIIDHGVVAASGTPAEARAKVQQYVDNGCTCPILYPLGDVTAMIDAFS